MSLLLNGRRMPEPMVKSEDDEIIIDLECTELPLPKGPLHNWHKQVITLLKKCYMTMSDTSFEDLLKFYRRSLSEQINSLNNETLIKDKILLHLSHIDNLYQESQTCFVYIPNYFDYLVDILTDYVNLEMEIIKHLKKKDMNRQGYVMLTKITALKICKVLSIYLKHNEEHIMHTLLKLRYEKKSVPCRDVLNKVYLHFLIQQPVNNPSDRAFCRNYLVLQNWKGILNSNQHEIMDKMLIEKFRQDDDYINKNETLKIIKTTKPKSTSRLFNQLMNRKSYDEEAYFDYLKKSEEHDDIPTLSEEVNCVSLDDDNSSKENWDSSYLFKNMMNNTSNRETFKGVLFEEEDNRCRPNNIFDNEVIAETQKNVPSSSELPSLICLIDDDSDIEEIVYFDNSKVSYNNIREDEPIVCIDLDDENSNDCIAIDETPTITNKKNQSEIMLVESVDVSDNRDATITQMGASSEKDSDFQETENLAEDIPEARCENTESENTVCMDKNMVTEESAVTEEPTIAEVTTVTEESTVIVESAVTDELTVTEESTVTVESTIAEVTTVTEESAVTEDTLNRNTEEPSKDYCNLETITTTGQSISEDEVKLISIPEIEDVPVLQGMVDQTSASIICEMQSDNQDTLLSTEQNVDIEMIPVHLEDTEIFEKIIETVEEPKIDYFDKKVCDTSSVSSESSQCYMEVNTTSNDMASNGVEQKRNCTDSETQTDPTTTTAFSSIYDTPPSDQFEAKSPEMSNNKYLTISNEAITNCVQEGLTCEMQGGGSESDKENFSDMENVENSDLDLENSDVNELLKNMNDDNSKADYEAAEYATSPLNHGTGSSENDGTIVTDDMDVEEHHFDEDVEEQSHAEPEQLKIIIQNVETISDEKFSAIEERKSYLSRKKDNDDETNGIFEEQPLIVEGSSEISAIRKECDFDTESNYVATQSDNPVPDDVPSTNRELVEMESQENNNDSPVSSDTLKNVDNETVQVNGIKVIENKKIVLPDICEKEETTPKTSTLKVMYTSTQIIKGDFSEKRYKEYNDDKCVCDTFKDAFSGPVTKLNGLAVIEDDFNILDAVQQSLLSNLQIKPQIVNGNSNTDTSNSSQPSSPNITCCQDMDYTDLRSDYECYMNQEMPTLQEETCIEIQKPIKAQKRVAISEDHNKFHQDTRTVEELKYIYSKRFRPDKKHNGDSIYIARQKRKESNYIRRIRKKDEKLQMEPVVKVEIYTEDELWQKLRMEIERREREKLERGVYYRKHNTTESRILFRLFPTKENNVDEAQSTLDSNYSNTGSDRSSRTMLHQNTNLHVEVNSRKRPVKRKNLSGVYTTSKRKRGRPPKGQTGSNDISQEFDKLKSTPSYVDCSYKSSSKVHM